MRTSKSMEIIAQGAKFKKLFQLFKRQEQFSSFSHQPFSFPLIHPQHVLRSGSATCHEITGGASLQCRLLACGLSLFQRHRCPIGSAEKGMASRNIAMHRQHDKGAGNNHEDISRLLGDKLVLRGLSFHGHHGVYDEERKLGQKFLVDMDAWLDLRKAGETDELEYSVNYAEIYRTIKDIVEGPPHNLLESVATTIVSDVFKKFPSIRHVRVKVGKPHVAVEGVVDYLGVEICRSRLNGEIRISKVNRPP